MAGEIKLEIGQRVVIDGCDFEFKRLLRASNPDADPRRDLQFEEIATGYIRQMSHAEFDSCFLAGDILLPSRLDRPGDRTADENATDKPLRELRQKLARAFDSNPVPKTDQALTDFAIQKVAELNIDTDWIPKGSTLRRWLRERGEPGNRRSKHMGRRREIGGRRKRLDARAEAEIAQESKLYFRKVGISSTDVYAAVRSNVAEHNEQRAREGLPPIRPPGRTTIWRRLREATNYDNAKQRFGRKKADQMFKPNLHFNKPSRILERVIIDDTTVDCNVVDENFPVTVGRPKLVVAFDAFSRCVLGTHLTFSDPSVETAMACLRDVVTPKAMAMSGLPDTVVFDRAWGNVGSSMNDALDDVGISIIAAAAGTPKQKARGEHFFDTLNNLLFHKIPGAVPFKPHDIKEHELDPIAEARLTLSELRDLTMKAIDVYHNSFHTGIKDIPARLWNECAKRGIPYPADILSFNMACAKLARPKILSSKGIELHSLLYSSPAVFDLLNDMLPVAPRRGHRAGTVEVKVKYFPEDLSRIFVWNTVRAAYVEIECVEKRYADGLSEYHHQKIEQFRRERALAWRSEDDRCIARTLLNREATSKLNSRLIGNRRRAQKILKAGASQAFPDAPDCQTAPVIPVECVSNRTNGHAPERIAVRKRTRAKPRGQATAQPASGPMSLNRASPAPDPFADYDRQALLDSIDGSE